MQRGLGLASGSTPGNAEVATSTPQTASAAGAAGPLEPVTYSDEDFVESERNRDPFRPHIFVAKPGEAPELTQRRVVMADTPIESMRLIAIITGTDRPRAMIVDPTEVGHVVERGMFIGRAQVVQASANVAMTLNWRVDRIRENEVVLSRQDPTDPTRPPLIHVIPLHEEVAQR